MKPKLGLFLILSIFMVPTKVFGAETSGTLPPDPNTVIPFNQKKYGDTFEISWTTQFKKTSKCKNSQIQFTSKRFLGAPEERAPGNGFYFYSADFKSILQTEGMYSRKLENKGSRFVFDFFLLDGAGKGGKLPADVITKCLTLDKNFRSPLQIYFPNLTGKSPYEGELIATIPFKEKK
jgi:hypothetical protein